MRWFITLLLAAAVGAGGFWLYAPNQVRALVGKLHAVPPMRVAKSFQTLQSIKVESIREIQLTVPGHPAARFIRSGGQWTQPGNWPARQGDVTELAGNLGLIDSLYAETAIASENDLVKYGLDPASHPIEVILTLKSENSEKSHKLIFGREKAAPGTPDFSLPTYLRIDDYPEVIRLDPTYYSVLGRSPDIYRSRRLVADVERHKIVSDSSAPGTATTLTPILGESVTRIEFETVGHPEKSYVLKRVDKTPPPRRDPERPQSEPTLTHSAIAEAWMLEGTLAGDDGKTHPFQDRVDPARLKEILTTLPDLYAERFVATTDMKPETTGLAAPERKLILSRGQEITTLLIGKVARKTERTEPTPPMRGMPSLPPRVIVEEYRYAKLKENDLVFEIRSDTLGTIEGRDLRDSRLVRFDPNDVTRVSLTRKGEEFHLQRKRGDKNSEDVDAQSDRWTLGEIPAESSKVAELLEQLARVESFGDKIVDNLDSEKRKALHLEEPLLKITLRLEPKRVEGEAPIPAKEKSFFVGARDAAGRRVPLQAGDRARVDWVDEIILTTLERPAQAYRGRRLFPATTQLTRIETSGAANWTLTREGTAWSLITPAKAVVDESLVARLADDLVRLDAIEYLDTSPTPENLAGKYGLAAPRATLTLTLGKTQRQIQVGSPREGKPEYHAQLDRAGPVMTLPAPLVDMLLKPATTFLPTRLLALTPDKLQRVSITRGTEVIQLDRTGDSWKLIEPFQTPVGREELKTVLTPFGDWRAESVDSLTSEPRHGLSEPALTLRVEEVGKSTVFQFGAETAPRSGACYVRRVGSDVVYVVADDFRKLLSRPATTLLDRTPYQLEASKIRKLKLMPRDGEAITLSKESTGWKAEGETFALDFPTLNRLLDQLARPDVTRIAAFGKELKYSEFGLEIPEMVIAFESLDSGRDTPLSHQIRIGKKTEQGERFVRFDESLAVTVMNATTAESYQLGRLDFVERRLFSLDPLGIARIKRIQGTEEFEALRGDSGWESTIPERKKCDALVVDELVEQIATLRSVKVAALAPDEKRRETFGLNKPVAVWTFSSVDDKAPKTLRIGGPIDPQSPEGDRYAAKDDDMAVIIPGTLAKRLLARPLAFRDRRLTKFVDADKLVLERGDRKATFAKTDGVWKLIEPTRAEAEQSELDDFVAFLAAFRAEEIVAEKPEDLTPFGLKEPELTWTAYYGNQEILKLPVGSSAKGVFTQVGDRVAKIDAKAAARVNAEYRRRSLWTDSDPAQVEMLIIDAGETKFVLRKQGGNWSDTKKPAEPLDREKITETVVALSNLKVDRYIVDGEAKRELYGLDKPRRVIAILQKGGTTHALTIGGPEGTSGGKQAYAEIASSEKSGIFLLSESDTAKLLRTDFSVTKPESK